MGTARPRAVLMGMACAGTGATLRALVGEGVAPRAVVLAGDEAAGGSEVAARARAAGAAVIVVDRARRHEPATMAAIAAHRPDLIVAACYPWRLPAELLTLPPLGCLNVHPSLLPVGRGPAPVFWTLRRGERRTGATVHRMDVGFDTGPIVAQAAIAVPLGARAPALEARLMALGGRLLVAALPGLAAGTLMPTPQDDAAATSAPPPTADGWAVPTNLPARWAYGFARGVAPLGGPLTLRVLATGETFPIADALDLAEDAVQTAPMVDEGRGVMRVRFRPGVVRLVVGAAGRADAADDGARLSAGTAFGNAATPRDVG